MTQLTKVILLVASGFLFVSVIEANTVVNEEAGDDSGEDETTSCSICEAELHHARQEIAALKHDLDEQVRFREEAELKHHEHVTGTKTVYNKTTGIYQTIACEGNTANISCPVGKTLKIEAADYGRNDLTTCKNPQMYTVNCSTEKAHELVSKGCSSVRSCKLHATNEVFGDPCVNTYKYMTVSYKCEEDLLVLD